MEPKNATDPERREQLRNEIATLMGPLVRELRSALLTCAGEFGLAPNEAQSLWVLALRGSVATKDLARALDIDPANASTLVTKLERRGLVRRNAAAHDRRKRLISLTADGAEVREQLAACVGERRPTFRELTTEELVTFRDLLRRVAAAR